MPPLSSLAMERVAQRHCLCAEHAQNHTSFTLARGISPSLLLEEIAAHPSVAFMAPEDQQHLIKALMEGYASLPPSIPGVRRQLLPLQLVRFCQDGRGKATLDVSHKLPLFLWSYLILLVLLGHMDLEAMLEGVLSRVHNGIMVVT
jgi:hypothetical protein